MSIFIVRLSKKHEVAGHTVNLPCDPEFQSFSAQELKQFGAGWAQQSITVEVLHDGEIYKKELAEAEAKTKKKVKDPAPTE